VSKSNLAASIRQRLKNHAKKSGESFNLILVRFGLVRYFTAGQKNSTAPHATSTCLEWVSPRQIVSRRSL